MQLQEWLQFIGIGIGRVTARVTNSSMAFFFLTDPPIAVKTTIDGQFSASSAGVIEDLLCPPYSSLGHDVIEDYCTLFLPSRASIFWAVNVANNGKKEFPKSCDQH